MRQVDSARVKEMIAAECERQMVGPVEVKQMHAAYEFARMLGGKRVSTVAIKHLGNLVEPVKGAGYRKLPATFANLSHAVDASLIDSAMNALIMHQVRLTTNEFVKEFLAIHPFADGNGRVAFLLYNILNNTLHYPDPLPDYSFEFQA
jgi:hypothetical protein